MHDFDYVTKAEWSPEQYKLKDLIHEVQDLLRDKFTFQYKFIGSTMYNMITRDFNSNIGYDFDVNIQPNDDEGIYDAKEIKHLIMNAFKRKCGYYGYSFCEDSTSVFTIKVIDHFHSRIVHSCDFAIVFDCNDGRQQYIRFNKEHNSYTWEYRGKGYNLEDEVKWLKATPKYWNEVKKLYLYKKNNNTDVNKKSRSLRAESINEIARKYGYKK